MKKSTYYYRRKVPDTLSLLNTFFLTSRNITENSETTNSVYIYN
ncbi:hypothetical protein [Chryseobacterium paridis]|nr:hypothetical protein [Chryseobacterium paridis]